jgi:hypothetical protein
VTFLRVGFAFPYCVFVTCLVICVLIQRWHEPWTFDADQPCEHVIVSRSDVSSWRHVLIRCACREGKAWSVCRMQIYCSDMYMWCVTTIVLNGINKSVIDIIYVVWNNFSRMSRSFCGWYGSCSRGNLVPRLGKAWERGCGRNPAYLTL